MSLDGIYVKKKETREPNEGETCIKLRRPRGRGPKTELMMESIIGVLSESNGHTNNKPK